MTDPIVPLLLLLIGFGLGATYMAWRWDASLLKHRASHMIIPTGYNLYKHVLSKHFTGQLASGRVFLYCPKQQTLSWSSEDVKHRWCHSCKLGFEQIERLETK